MVSITILLLLCLITESAGILHDDIDISSKLNRKSMQNGGSTFSKTLNYMTDFKGFCRTFLSKLESKR